MINKMDQELLMLAAMAAGVEGEYQHWEDSRDAVSCGIAPKGAVGREWWNPLTNEGTRYRLAKTLKMTIDFSFCTVWKRVDDHTLIQEFWGGVTGNDEAHAIVRVAAEVGELQWKLAQGKV